LGTSAQRVPQPPGNVGEGEEPCRPTSERIAPERAGDHVLCSPNVLAITCFRSAGILPVILDPPEDAGGTPALCEGDHGGLVPPPCGVHLLVVSGMLLRAITVVCSRVTHYTEPYVLKIGSGVCALPQGRELV